jgi:hypothetical protein
MVHFKRSVYNRVHYQKDTAQGQLPFNQFKENIIFRSTHSSFQLVHTLPSKTIILLCNLAPEKKP